MYNKKAGKFVDSKKYKHPMIREGDYGVMKFSNEMSMKVVGRTT